MNDWVDYYFISTIKCKVGLTRILEEVQYISNTVKATTSSMDQQFESNNNHNTNT